MSDLCSKCDRKLDTYYGKWCVICDKDKAGPQQVSVINVVRALRHIEALTGNQGYKARMWSMFLDTHQVTNDTCVWFYYPEDYLDQFGGARHHDFQLFMDTFGLTPDSRILLEFSW